MVNRANPYRGDGAGLFDGRVHAHGGQQWLAARFDALERQLAGIEEAVSAMHEGAAAQAEAQAAVPREYYSVPEFAGLVDRNAYTVREWCRLGRIHAEKCESGRGDAKNWKIPADELVRYRDHGLLPL